MSKSARKKTTPAQQRTAYRARREAKLRAEERSWAAQSGPVRIFYRRPPQDADLQGDYDEAGAAGSASLDKPGA